MSDKKHRHRHRVFNGKSFIILPIIFFVGIYLVLYIALNPMITTVTSIGGFMFSDLEIDYSTSYKNIFVPLATENNESNKNEKLTLDKIEYPMYGNQFGELIIEDCDIDSKLFFGDGEVALRNGVGVYNGSFIPGYGKTILVAGHNNTDFNGLKNSKEGQIVKIRTSYGNYEYKITKKEIKRYDDKSAYDLTADHENLIMYTCYPFDELGLTEYRYFVYAEYVSGPKIDKTVQGVD